jgi:hypothetical protein
MISLCTLNRTIITHILIPQGVGRLQTQLRTENGVEEVVWYMAVATARSGTRSELEGPAINLKPIKRHNVGVQYLHALKEEDPTRVGRCSEVYRASMMPPKGKQGNGHHVQGTVEEEPGPMG